MEHVTRICPASASEPGALSGFEVTCSCGDKMRSSIEILAQEWAREHKQYWHPDSKLRMDFTNSSAQPKKKGRR